jgi:crossover junction endodeoxyribonuclease RuvC
MSENLVLGIDPGTRFIGYGLIRSSASKFTYIASGVIRLDESLEINQRLFELKEKFTALIEMLPPDEIAFESLIFVKSPTVLTKLSLAKGLMIGCLPSSLKEKVFDYAPNYIKQTVTGYGHADKEAGQKMLKLLLNKSDFSTSDESDALLIALTHALAGGLKGKRSNAKSGLAASVAHRSKEVRL